MKKDWMGTFLPLWAVGTVVWMIGGFVVMPEAFRRSLIMDRQDVYVSTIYDITDIDPEIAVKLGIIMGVPVLLVMLAILVAAVQRVRRGPVAPFK